MPNAANAAQAVECRHLESLDVESERMHQTWPELDATCQCHCLIISVVSVHGISISSSKAYILLMGRYTEHSRSMMQIAAVLCYMFHCVQLQSKPIGQKPLDTHMS